MTIYRQFFWPAVDTKAICALQNVAAAGPLLFNGTLADPFNPNQVSLIGAGFTRNLSLTSANDLSAATFTVSGLQNGASITANFFGPNNETIDISSPLDIVTSITVDMPVNGISVGTGVHGFLPLVEVDTQMNTGMLNYTLQTILNLDNAINYSVYYTSANIYQLGITYESLIEDYPGYIATYDGNLTSPQLFQNYLVVKYFLLGINTAADTDTLQCIYLQIQ